MNPRTLPALLAALVTLPASAQNYGQQRQVRTKAVEGEIKEIRGSRLIVEIDGKTGPLPVDRNTELVVTGKGDLGFLRPGAVVVVSGTLRPDGTVAGADFAVHPDPKRSVDPQVRRVNAADPQITVAGRLLSLEPFQIKALDSIAMVKGEGDTWGINILGVGEVPPAGSIQNAVLTVNLRDGKPQEVSVNLGPSPQLIAPGDWFVASFREDRPQTPYHVRVRKEEPLKSGATPADKDGEKTGGEKADGEKKTDEKPNES